MLKTLAMVFGVVFLLLGILGFVPALAPDGILFGLEVDATQNIIHLIIGAAALWWGMSEEGARKFFRIFGVVFLVLAALGFYYGDNDLLGIMAHNSADTYLHLVMAVIFLILGFAMKKRDSGMGMGGPAGM